MADKIQTRVKFHNNQAELIKDVSGPIFGPYAEWPSNVTDEIERALEDLRVKTKKAYQLVVARSDQDTETGLWYIHVLAEYVEAVTLQ